MSEIYLNELELAYIRMLIDNGSKSGRINDLFINVTAARVTVTNVHTGKEIRLLNWTK